MINDIPYGSVSNFKGAQHAKPKSAADVLGKQGLTIISDPHCKGCIYYDGRICDYIGATGHPRILDSPPPKEAKPGEMGKYCTVKKLTEKKAKKEPKALTLKGSIKKKRAKSNDTSSTASGSPSPQGEG